MPNSLAGSSSRRQVTTTHRHSDVLTDGVESSITHFRHRPYVGRGGQTNAGGDKCLSGIGGERELRKHWTAVSVGDDIDMTDMSRNAQRQVGVHGYGNIAAVLSNQRQFHPDLAVARIERPVAKEALQRRFNSLIGQWNPQGTRLC